MLTGTKVGKIWKFISLEVDLGENVDEQKATIYSNLWLEGVRYLEARTI